MAREGRGANNPITRLRSVKNRSCAINTDCLSGSSGGFSRKALRKRGVTGETLLQLLETRLDNVVYRLGFANTRSAARQLVSHGHVLVNGRRVNVASYNVKAGDEITIKDKPKSRQLVLRNLDLTQIAPVPDWLTVDRDGAQRQSCAHPVSGRDATDRQRTAHRRAVFALKAPRGEIPFVSSIAWDKTELDENFRLILVRRRCVRVCRKLRLKQDARCITADIAVTKFTSPIPPKSQSHFRTMAPSTNAANSHRIVFTFDD